MATGLGAIGAAALAAVAGVPVAEWLVMLAVAAAVATVAAVALGATGTTGTGATGTGTVTVWVDCVVKPTVSGASTRTPEDRSAAETNNFAEALAASSGVGPRPLVTAV